MSVSSKAFPATYSLLFIAAAASLLWNTPAEILDDALADTELAEKTFEATPHFECDFLHVSPGTPSVHAGTITELADGTLLAGWFGGTREGARDVAIYASRRSPGSEWSHPEAIATREDTVESLGRYIRKLGNPVIYRDSEDRVWLFYVAVSIGGWSGSFIVVKSSDDNGRTWTPAKRLVTSPFLNISTLLKGSPLQTTSGHLVLPVYHEFVQKFGELLWLNRDGDLVYKNKISPTTGTLQPWLVPTDQQQIRAFYRQSGHPENRVLTNTADRLSGPWTDPESIDVPNPNSATAVIHRNGGGYLMAANPTEAGRKQLALAISDDGVNWRFIKDLENESGKGQFSYPYAIRSSDGNYHVIYTWNRKRMRIATFNDAWLEAQQ